MLSEGKIFLGLETTIALSMSQLRKLNQTQTKEKGVAVVTPQRSYSNLLEDLIKDIVASNIILLISVLPLGLPYNNK